MEGCEGRYSEAQHTQWIGSGRLRQVCLSTVHWDVTFYCVCGGGAAPEHGPPSVSVMPRLVQEGPGVGHRSVRNTVENLCT